MNIIELKILVENAKRFEVEFKEKTGYRCLISLRIQVDGLHITARAGGSDFHTMTDWEMINTAKASFLAKRLIATVRELYALVDHVPDRQDDTP